MGFFDLNIPFSYLPPAGGKAIVVDNTLRVKLAMKAMELGYVGIAHNHSIRGPMSDKDRCTIPLLTLGSLIKAAPRLVSSVGFHRDLLGVPRATPFRQYTRVTVLVENEAQRLSLNSGNQILKSYDVVAVTPLNQKTFEHACAKAEVDIISIDFSNMSFHLIHAMVNTAIKRGIYFEINYSDLLSLKDAEKRRQVISNAKLLVDWTKGKNLIISSGAPSVTEHKYAPSVTELRGPNDVINLMSLLGISTERARAAISNNCRNMITKVLKKKRFHKEAVKVELVSSGETFSLEKPLSEDRMKWDPISSGEGDMLLDDIAKAFDATRAVPRKPSKAIDFTSVRNGLPSHGFRVKDIVGTEPLAQPPPVHSNNQVSDVRMADSASSNDKTRSQTDTQMSEDESKVVERRAVVPLRKCSTSQEQGILVPIQAAASLTLIRCTKLDAASDVNMHTESVSEDKSLSPSKSCLGIPECPAENLNMETDAEPGHRASLGDKDDDDEMKIDASAVANHYEDMEVTVEDQKHETGDSNINLPNLSSETNELLRELGNKSLSPEAVGQDHDQVSRLESNEAELQEEPSVPCDNTLEITMEDEKEGETETETNQQAHVQSSERDNATNSGKEGAKRSRVRLARLQPFKPFLLQSRFKRISKRRKHRRA
uniref:Ribonuclease P protein subunit p30 n=1 Tax=Noccaea caerulescens TaxID=107243 RepID=A0A1J3CKF4_NOCCA